MSADTVVRWCYEHDCYEHPDNESTACTHALPDDDCSFVMVPVGQLAETRTLWHVHYRCGCWVVHLRKPERREPVVCSEHGRTKAMTAFEVDEELEVDGWEVRP